MTRDFVRTGFEDEDEDETKRIPPPAGAVPEVASLQASQEAYARVVDRLVELYRTFDRRRRKDLKENGLEAVYEALKELGQTVGVSRFALPRLADC